MPLRLSLCALLSCFTAVALPAQTGLSDPNTAMVFKTTTHTVVVDVVVTGRNGQPVHGLHQQDFAVAEDGHPQQTNFFEEHVGSQAMPAALPPLPSHIFSNVPRVTPTDSVTVLLLDSLNTPMADQASVHKQMRQYLENLQPGRRFAIFSLNRRLRLVQGFTDDPSLLAAGLKSQTRGAGGPQSSPLLRSYTEDNAIQHLIDDLTSLGPGGAQAAAGIAALDGEQKDRRTMIVR